MPEVAISLNLVHGIIYTTELTLAMRNYLISNIFWLCTSPPTLLGSIEAIQATLGSNCSEHNFPWLSLNPREVILSQQRDRHLRAIETANYLQILTENTDNYPEHQPTVLLMVPSVGSNSNSTGLNSTPPPHELQKDGELIQCSDVFIRFPIS